jgi:hypothetical protein
VPHFKPKPLSQHDSDVIDSMIDDIFISGRFDHDEALALRKINELADFARPFSARLQEMEDSQSETLIRPLNVVIWARAGVSSRMLVE